MNHVVLVHPAIPQNTGNIMRTCAATHTPLHIIKPTGFKLNDPRMKRAVMDYFDHLTFKVYENFEEFEKRILVFIISLHVILRKFIVKMILNRKVNIIFSLVMSMMVFLMIS